MMNAALIKLGRLCTRLSGFARGVGKGVAADASEPFRQELGGMVLWGRTATWRETASADNPSRRTHRDPVDGRFNDRPT